MWSKFFSRVRERCGGDMMLTFVFAGHLLRRSRMGRRRASCDAATIWDAE